MRPGEPEQRHREAREPVAAAGVDTALRRLPAGVAVEAARAMSARTRSIWATVTWAPASAATRRSSWTWRSVERRLGQGQLLQRPQPPGRQPVPFRQVGGLLEEGHRLGRRRQAAQHLQRLALDLRPVRRGGGRATRRAAVPRRAGRRPGRRARRRRPADARSRRREPGHRAGALDVGGSGLRVTGGERGPREERAGARPAGRPVRPARSSVRSSACPSRPRRPGLPGVHEDRHQHLVGIGRGRRPGRGQQPGAFGRQLRAGQRAAGQRAPGALDRERRRRLPVPGRLGELGGQLAPRAGQPGVRPLHRDERPRRQRGPLRREELGEHGLARQRVPEPEPLAVHGDELRVDRPAQRRHGRRAVDGGDARQQVPVEAAAQHRRGGEHLPRVAVERLQAGAQRLGEAGGDRRRRPHLGPPPAVRPDEGTRGDEPGQQLLDEERQAVAVLGDEAGDPAASASAPARQARTICVHSGSGSGASGRTVAARRLRNRSSRSADRDGRSVRVVARHSTRSVVSVSAR